MNFNTITLYYIPLLLTLVSLSFFILYKAPKSKTNRIFSGFIISIAFWVLCLLISDGSRDYNIVLFWTRLAIIGPVIAIYLLVIFSYIFPYERTPLRLQKVLFLSIIPSFFVLTTPTDFNVTRVILHPWGTEPIVGYLYTLLIPFLLSYLFLTFKNFYVKYKESKEYYGFQIIYVSFGISLTIGIGVVTNLILILLGKAQYSILGPVSTLFIIAFTSFSIVKYRFLELRLTLTRSIIFTLLTFFVSSLIIGTTFLSTNLLKDKIYTQYSVQVLMSVMIVLLFQPTKFFLGKITDKFLFKAFVDYPSVTSNLSNIINKEYELEGLIKQFTETLKEALKISFVKVVLFYKSSGLDTENKKIVNLKKTPELFTFLNKNKGVLLVNDLDHLINNSTNKQEQELFIRVRQQFDSLKSTVLIPVFFNDNLIALILIGNKLSGSPFTLNDVELFELLVPQIASGIQKARLYQESLVFSYKLKQEIGKATSDLKAANEHLKELDTAKSEFISIASHQLRTPLTGIMGYLSMIVDGDFGKIDPAQLKILKDVYAASTRLIRIVNIFLNVSRIEAGRFYLDYKKVTFESVVDEIIMELKPTATKKGISLAIDSSVKQIGEVTVDPDKLKDVMLNLVDNAIKYSQQGTITVSAKKEGDQLHGFVQDQGVGIDPEEAKRLFSKFVRGTGIARVQPNGSGLGLFIAKKVVEEHGGKIWVESTGVGKGSTFQFVIPLKPSAAQVDLQAKIASKVSKQKAKAKEELTATGA